jgi:glycerol kinase
MWINQKEIERVWIADRVFTPKMEEERSIELYKGWNRALQRSLEWIQKPADDE